MKKVKTILVLLCGAMLFWGCKTNPDTKPDPDQETEIPGENTEEEETGDSDDEDGIELPSVETLVSDDYIFYFSYDKDFNLKERFHYYYDIYDGDKLIETVDLSAAGLIGTEGTPSSVFDGKNLEYKIPLKYIGETTKINGIDISDEIKKINNSEIYVYIGKRGDANLDFSVDSSDASIALTFYAYIGNNISKNFDKAFSSIYDFYKNFTENISIKDENELYNFAKKGFYYLCDINSDGVIDAGDASLILTYYAYYSSGNSNYTEMSEEELWKEVYPDN